MSKKRKTLFLEFGLGAVIFQHMVTFFPKIFFRLLGTDAKCCVLIGNSVTLEEPFNTILLRGGDGHGHIAHFCQTAVEQLNGIDGRQLTIDTDDMDYLFPHRFVGDWYDYQADFINHTDLMALTEAPLYEESARLSKVIPYKNKKLLKKDAIVRLYGDRITVDDRVFHFDDTSAVVVLGRNKLNIYADKELFQLKGSKRFNALKYVHFFHRYQNIKGGKNDEFLGL